MAGEIVYMLSRFTDGKRDAIARLSEGGGSKRPASSNRGVWWNWAPKSSPSAMRGLVKSGEKSSLLRPGVERKSSKGDSMEDVKNLLGFAEEDRGREAASRLISGDVV